MRTSDVASAQTSAIKDQVALVVIVPRLNRQDRRQDRRQGRREDESVSGRPVNPWTRKATPLPAAGVEADARLLARAAGGAQDAFRTLVARHLPAMLAIGRRMLGDDAEAEDVAQETMLRLWRNASAIEVGDAGVKPWLNRVASNLCLDRLRARKSAPELRDELPDRAASGGQQRQLEEAELSRNVDAALQALPERQRLALVLFHYQGLTQNEAAEALGVSAEALESLLSRARRTLKAALAGEWRTMLPDLDDTA